jgi:hypothetical protein
VILIVIEMVIWSMTFASFGFGGVASCPLVHCRHDIDDCYLGGLLILLTCVLFDLHRYYHVASCAGVFPCFYLYASSSLTLNGHIDASSFVLFCDHLRRHDHLFAVSAVSASRLP